METTPLLPAPDYLGGLVDDHAKGNASDNTSDNTKDNAKDHASQNAGRRLLIRREFDPQLFFAREAGFERAFAELLDFAAESVPPGCEVTVAAMRTTAAVARLGAGKIVLRWQVRGAPDEPPTSNVVPIHPVEADGPTLVASPRAERLRSAFEEAGWEAALESIAEGREIWVQLSRG